MNFRKITPFIILMAFVAIMFQVGCDTLITESNTTILIDSTLAIGCFNCHNDEDNILLRPRGQFDNSAHASYALLDIIDVSCTKCHTHEGFLKSVDSSITSVKAYSAINCYTCHLPHTGEYGAWDMDTLRASSTIDFVSGLGADFGTSNTCAHCHSATQDVGSGSTVVLDENFGPHVSPQADIVSGRNGYFINIEAPETNQHAANGCIKCHYGGYNEGQGYMFAEHTFRLEDKNTSQQYFATCNVSGCHLGELITDFYSDTAILIIDSLADSVKSLLASYEIIDSADTSGLTYTIDDTVSQVLAKSYYNFLLFKNDRSRGIHNIGFVTELLDTTIDKLDSLPAITSFTVDDSLGCFGKAITFTPSLTGAFDVLYWNFGDGNIDTTTVDTSITNIYSTPGTYSVSLISESFWSKDSTTNGGVDSTGDTTFIASSMDTLFKTDFVIIDDAPIADFIVDIDTACVGEAITFTSTSTHLLPASMIWNFGDADSSLLPDATHAYSSSGSYTVSLEVTTGCGVDSIIMVDLITILTSPTAAFTATRNAAPDTLTYQFTDASTGGVASWDWKFLVGTGTDVIIVDSSTAQNPTYTFTDPVITKRAILTVLNGSGCMDVDTVIIFTPLN